MYSYVPLGNTQMKLCPLQTNRYTDVRWALLHLERQQGIMQAGVIFRLYRISTKAYI
jgi:hypothetical protein